MNQHLIKSLSELNEWLKTKNKTITLHVIGGLALVLQGLNIKRTTGDVDNVNPIIDNEVIAKIYEIGDKNGTPDWFDFGATTLTLPYGYISRLVRTEGMSNIEMYVLHKRDLVVLKVAAYFSRRHRGVIRDLEDLVVLNPTFEEVCNGLDFIVQEYGVNQQLPSQFLNDLSQEVAKLKEEFSAIFK